MASTKANKLGSTEAKAGTQRNDTFGGIQPTSAFSAMKQNRRFVLDRQADISISHSPMSDKYIFGLSSYDPWRENNLRDPKGRDRSQMERTAEPYHGKEQDSGGPDVSGH